MSGVLIITFILFLVLMLSLKIINENQRGVLFRLGRFEKVIGPGLVFTLPSLDRLLKIDLNEKVPGWQGLSADQLDAKVKELALGELK